MSIFKDHIFELLMPESRGIPSGIYPLTVTLYSACLVLMCDLWRLYGDSKLKSSLT